MFGAEMSSGSKLRATTHCTVIEVWIAAKPTR